MAGGGPRTKSSNMVLKMAKYRQFRRTGFWEDKIVMCPQRLSISLLSKTKLTLFKGVLRSQLCTLFSMFVELAPSNVRAVVFLEVCRSLCNYWPTYRSIPSTSVFPHGNPEQWQRELRGNPSKCSTNSLYHCILEAIQPSHVNHSTKIPFRRKTQQDCFLNTVPGFFADNPKRTGTLIIIAKPNLYFLQGKGFQFGLGNHFV